MLTVIKAIASGLSALIQIRLIRETILAKRLIYDEYSRIENDTADLEQTINRMRELGDHSRADDLLKRLSLQSAFSTKLYKYEQQLSDTPERADVHSE
jgi:hypothetical protein